MFIAVNRIQVPEERRHHMIEAFEKAVPAMKRFKGFLGMELWTAEDNTLLGVSRWESKEAMEEYTNNELFRQHHGGTSREHMNAPQPEYYDARILS